MKKFAKQRINTFFIEIIVVTLFFSLTSTIIVNVFAQTNYDIDVNKIKSNAIVNARCIGDIYSSTQDVQQALMKTFGNKCDIYTDNNNRYVVQLDIKLTQSKDKNDIVLIVTEEKAETEAGIYGELKFEYEFFDNKVFKTTSASYFAK